MYLANHEHLFQINVDVQNDFCPGGTLAVPDGHLVVPTLNDMARVVRANGGQVIYTRDWHPRETNHFAEFGGPWPVHCVAGTQGAEFHPDLEVLPQDIVISKGALKDEDAYSGFQGHAEDGRTLEEIVRPVGKLQRYAILIGGLATDYCVKATAIDAFNLIHAHIGDGNEVRVYAMMDAMRAVDVKPNDHYAAIEEMINNHVEIVTTDVIKSAIQSRNFWSRR